jgi:mannose-1-phosphate guanylyltransferase
MKAFLLASGYGMRLRPITDRLPKCLVPVHGVPLLDWWLLLLRTHGVTEVVVNTHYLYETVRAFIDEYNKRRTGLTVNEYYEPELLGSGGTVRANRKFIDGGEDFLICYADNLTDFNLSGLVSSHREWGGILTMALFHASKPKECGIVALDARRKVIDFEEKPKNPKTNLANAGIYVAKGEIFDLFPSKEPLDFGKDVLPLLVGKMYGWETPQYLIDIGSMDNYKRGEAEWRYDYHPDAFKN